jgi:epoxyqueuosine reductase QueG
VLKYREGETMKRELIKSSYPFGIIEYQKYLEYIHQKGPKKYKDMKSLIVFIYPFSNTLVKGKYLPAKFAYGKDYHQEVKELIEDAIEDLKLTNYEIKVDVSSLKEKTCAYLAGLGLIGKNSLLINEKYGSYIAIGIVITDEVFNEYDRPIEGDYCKDCNRCIKACPNKALSSDGLDKKKCLSYLNQSKSTDYLFFDKMKYLYGCDICQDVCPYNKIKDYGLESFLIDEEAYLSLEELKSMDEKEYLEKYQDKTFNWIGYLPMVRNLLVLKVNNKDITKKELEFFQEKHKSEKWFYDHIEYLKEKLDE